jgi:hypothetical protein
LPRVDFFARADEEIVGAGRQAALDREQVGQRERVALHGAGRRSAPPAAGGRDCVRTRTEVRWEAIPHHKIICGVVVRGSRRADGARRVRDLLA